MIWVCQVDLGVCFVQVVDYFFQGWLVLFDVFQFVGFQLFVECVGVIFDLVVLDQEFGEMWLCWCVVVVVQGLLDCLCVFQCIGYIFGCKLLVDFFGVCLVVLVQGFGCLVQGSGVEVEIVVQYMNGGIVLGVGQFDIVDQFDIELSGCLVGFWQVFQGVVVGQCQQFDVFFVGLLYQGGGCEYVIGGGIVVMQIDMYG